MNTVSPVEDKRFMELVKLLDTCSRVRGRCENCLLLDDCQAAFDSLMNTRTHYQIRQSDIDMFKNKFVDFNKQLTFC